jgi:hypothetical protein
MHDSCPEEPEPEQAETFAPLIFVRDADWAAAAVCDVLERFPQAVRLVERLTTRPPRNMFDGLVCHYISPDMFGLLAEFERIIPARNERCEEGFLQVALNHVLTGDGKTFGIVVGDETLEAELRQADYEVRTFILQPEGVNSPEWDADRLAEFVFGLIDEHAEA